MAESISLMFLILIAGLGLGGASASECNQILHSAGYDFSYSQVEQISEYANDPDVLSYVNSYSSELTSAYNSGAVAPSANAQDTITYLDQFKEDHPYLYPVLVTTYPPQVLDEMGFNNVVTVELPVATSHVTKVNDGQGGYFYLDYADISSQWVNLYHVDADGNQVYISGYSTGYGNFTAFDLVVTQNPDNPNVADISVIGDYHGAYDFPMDCINTSYELGKTVDPAVDSISQTFAIDEDGNLVLPDGTVIPCKDGVFTLPDGTVITLNPDGSYSVGERSFTPVSTVDGSIIDLLKQLLDNTEGIENALTFENTGAIDDANAQAVGAEAADSYNGDLSELKVPEGIASVFPFCIPFDFVRGVKLFSAQPVNPRFEVEFVIPSVGAYPGTRDVVVLDFSDYDKYFVIVRWGSTIIFMLSLCFVTTKIVKGAGA